MDDLRTHRVIERTRLETFPYRTRQCSTLPTALWSSSVAIRLPQMAVLVCRTGCARQRMLPGTTRRGVLGCPGPSPGVQAAASGLPRNKKLYITSERGVTSGTTSTYR